MKTLAAKHILQINNNNDKTLVSISEAELQLKFLK